MPQPYSSETRVDRLIGDELTNDLQDLDEDAAEDTGVYSEAQKAADLYIDARLGKVYVVPFAGNPITDYEATPPGDLALICQISTWLVAAELFQKRHPEGTDHKTWRDKAEAMLKALAAEELFLNAPRVADDAGATAIAYDAPDPLFWGTDDVDRMEGW